MCTSPLSFGVVPRQSPKQKYLTPLYRLFVVFDTREPLNAIVISDELTLRALPRFSMTDNSTAVYHLPYTIIGRLYINFRILAERVGEKETREGLEQLVMLLV